MRTQNRFIAFFFAFLIVAMAGCAGSSTKRGTGEYIDDTAISTKVKSALFADPDTSAVQVNIETYRGVVKISGFVDSQAKINRTVEVARSVEGVKEVRNNMTVRQ